MAGSKTSCCVIFLYLYHRSDVVCGAMCLTAQNNCTGFKMDRNQCHLLRSWSFASEPGDPKGGVKVHQLNVSGTRWLVAMDFFVFSRSSVTCHFQMAF